MPIARLLGRAADWPGATGFPSTSTVAGNADQHAEQREQQFPLALAVQPAEAHDLAGPHLQRDGFQPIGPGQVARPPAWAAWCGALGGGLRRKDVALFAADHQLDHCASVLVPSGIGRALRPLRTPSICRRFPDFVHAVRDVEQREPLVAQTPQHPEDLARPPRSAPRSPRPDAGCAGRGERLGDLHHLPARQRQIPHRRQRMNVLVRPRGASACSAMRRWARRSISPKRRGGVPMKILSATEKIGDERQFLEDAGDPWYDLRRPARGRRPRGPSSVMRPTSGATTPAMILISVDLPAPFSPRIAWMLPACKDQARILQRAHAPVALGDVLHAKDGRGRCVVHYGH